MKRLLLLTAIAIFASCDRNCEEMKDSLHSEYIQALQGAITPAAQEEITRQYNEKLNNLDC